MPLAPCSLLGIGKPPRAELGPILEPSLEALGRSQGWPRIASKLSRSPTSTRMHWRNRSCRIKLKSLRRQQRKYSKKNPHLAWFRYAMAEPELCSTDLLVRLKGNVSAHLNRQIVQLEENSIFQRKHHPVPNHTVIVWLTTSKELEFSPCQIVKGKELKFSPCQREGCRGTRRWRPHHRNDPPGSIQVASKLVCLEKKVFFLCFFLPAKGSPSKSV